MARSVGNENAVPERFQDAVVRLDGDAALLRQMAAMTSPDFAGLIADSESAIRDNDGEAAVRSLHKLKGMLSTFESDGVVLEIQEMIAAARKGNVTSAGEHFRRHRGQIEELVDVVTQFSQSS